MWYKFLIPITFTPFLSLKFPSWAAATVAFTRRGDLGLNHADDAAMRIVKHGERAYHRCENKAGDVP